MVRREEGATARREGFRTGGGEAVEVDSDIQRVVLEAGDEVDVDFDERRVIFLPSGGACLLLICLCAPAQGPAEEL